MNHITSRLHLIAGTERFSRFSVFENRQNLHVYWKPLRQVTRSVHGDFVTHGAGQHRDYALIMVSKLSNKDSIVFNFVNYSLFIIVSTGPIARDTMPKGFWFSNPFIRNTLNIVDEEVNSF